MTKIFLSVIGVVSLLLAYTFVELQYTQDRLQQANTQLALQSTTIENQKSLIFNLNEISTRRERSEGENNKDKETLDVFPKSDTCSSSPVVGAAFDILRERRQVLEPDSPE